MRAYRSSLKLFVFGIVGILLIAAAADIMFGHWVSTPPDDNNGVLTTRGLAQQRGDLVWGGAMLATGVLLFGGSITELVRRRATVSVNGDGLLIDTGGEGDLIPWSSIDSISSGVFPDAYDGSMREQLVVDLGQGTVLAEGLAGIPREGDKVFIDAHDWASRVTEVALSAQGAHDHFRRIEAVRNFEPPSVVWETTVSQSEPEPQEEDE